MKDEEMFAKLEALLLGNEEEQLHFPFQPTSYPPQTTTLPPYKNNQYLLFG